MSEPEAARLMAELWYADVPDLQDPRLLAALRAVSGEAELQDQSITVPHNDVTMELEDGVVPLLSVVFPGSALGVDSKTLPDVSQTWDWAAAEETIGRRASASPTRLPWTPRAWTACSMSGSSPSETTRHA